MLDPLFASQDRLACLIVKDRDAAVEVGGGERVAQNAVGG